MKVLLMWMLMFTSSFTQAAQCSLGSFSESKMHLGNYYRSQTATSFNVNCDRAYMIQFSSMNLRSSDGASSVSNGQYKLNTRMSISGASQNLWNIPLTHDAGLDSKYVIAVQLDDSPMRGVPAGIYRDMIFIKLMF